MRAFLVLLGGILLIVSIVVFVLSFFGKVNSSIGLVILIVALIMIDVGRRYF